VEFANLSQPSLAGRVKLYGKDTPIFEEFGVQEQINNAMKSKVWLKSGGYIVINQTEALVAIDVNTGKYVGKTQRLEDTIVKTNVDAIKEIVRQIRLRDLGGIIVIDFIDMDERKNRQRVMLALEEALRKDRAPSKALQFNDFGLVAITRKRVKQPLEKALGCACPYCTGSGFVKSAQTVSLEILAEARKMILSGSIERNTITLRVNPEVARYMKQTGASIIAEIEELAKKPLIVKGDINLHQENFDIH
jgi:ribonuclease G